MSGSGRENPPASNSGLNKKNFLKKHTCLRTIELLCSLNIEGDTYSLVPPPKKNYCGGSVPPRNLRLCTQVRVLVVSDVDELR